MTAFQVRLAATGAALLAGATFGLSLPGPALAQCLPMTCKFSISGKKGPFLDREVMAETIQRADASMAAGLNDGRALSSASVNKGGFAGTAISMPGTEAALMQLLTKIRGVWPHRAPMPTSVRIIGKTDYSPVAKPDGVIVVPLGLLIQASSDDEVAWVIAHEFSHIALAHFSREAQQRRLKSSVDSIVACSRIGFELAQHRVGSNNGQLLLTRQEDRGISALSAQVWAKSQMVGTILEIYNQRLSRKQEDQADVAGLDLALKAGFSDAGFGTALDTVAAEQRRHGSLIDEFGKDMARYTQQAALTSGAQLAQGGESGNVVNNFFKGLLRNAAALAFDKVLDMVKAGHRPAGKRKEGLSKYFVSAYSAATPPEEKRVWLDAIRATPEFKEAQLAVNARAEALNSLVSPTDPTDPKEVARVYAGATSALVKISPALNTRFARTPLIQNAIAQIDMAVHDYTGADRSFDIANRSPESAPAPAPARRRGGRGKAAAPAPVPVPAARPDPYLQQSLEGFQEHVGLLLLMRNYNKALSVIGLAKARFGDDDGFLPALIAIYAQTNRKEQLIAAIDRCGAVQDDVLNRACDVALIDPRQQEKIALLPPDDRAKFMSKLASVSADARRGSSCGIVSNALGSTED